MSLNDFDWTESSSHHEDVQYKSYIRTDHFPATGHEVCAIVVVEDPKKPDRAGEVLIADDQTTQRLVQVTFKAQADGGGDRGNVPSPPQRQLPSLQQRLADVLGVVGHLTVFGKVTLVCQ